MSTYRRMASDLSAGPVLAAGNRAATTGTVRWKALRTRVSFIQRASGGDISMVSLRCMLRASERQRAVFSAWILKERRPIRGITKTGFRCTRLGTTAADAISFPSDHLAAPALPAPRASQGTSNLDRLSYSKLIVTNQYHDPHNTDG